MANYNRYVDNTRIVYFDDGSQGNLSLPGMLRVDNIEGNTYTLGPEFTISSLNVSADIVAPGTHYSLPAHNANTYDYEKLAQSWGFKENIRRWTDVALSATGQYQVACATNDKLYMSADYGDTWDPVDTLLNAAGLTISGVRNWACVAISESGAHATACVANGSLYTSADYGFTWMAVANPAAASWSHVAMSANGKHQVAVCNPGFIWISDDYGATWRQATTVSRKWTGVAMSAMGDKLYACATDDALYMSRDYGVTWTATTAQSPSSWVSVATSTDGMTVLAATRVTRDALNQQQDGYLYVSADYGDSWNERTIDAKHREWRNVTMSATGQFQIATAIGDFVFVSLDYGFTWINTLTSKAWTGASISKNAQYVTVCADNEYLYKSYIMTYFYGGVEASTVRTGAVYTPWLSTAYAETNMAIGSSISSITTRTHSMYADRAEMSTIYASTMTVATIDAMYIQVIMQSTTQISTTITLANEISVDLLKSKFQDAQHTEISTLFVENTSSLNMYISTLRADTSDLMSTSYASLRGLNLSTGLAQVGRLEVSEQIASSISSINTRGATSFHSSIVGNNMSTIRSQVGAMIGGTVNVLQLSTGIFTNGAAQISSVRANNMSTIGAQVGALLTSSITTHYMSSGLALFGPTSITSLTAVSASTIATRADTFVGNAASLSSISTGVFTASSITSRSLFANTAQLDAYLGTNAIVDAYTGRFMYVSTFSTIFASAENKMTAPNADFTQTVDANVVNINTLSTGQAFSDTHVIRMLSTVNVRIGNLSTTTANIGGILTTNGNVGIGTIAPSNYLHIQKGIFSRPANDTDGTSFGIHFGSADYIDQAKLLCVDRTTSGGAWSGELALYTGINGSSERMRISASGNVGIGTTAPSETLQVNGTVAFQEGTGNGRFRFASASGANYIQSGLNATTGSAASLVFTSMNAGAEWMRITNEGRVIIGGTATDTAFEVVNTNSGGDACRIRAGDASRYATLNFVNSAGTAASIGIAAANLPVNPGRFYIYSAGAERFTISTTGDTTITGNLRFNNTNTLSAANTLGAQETFLWPRSSDNAMYMNYGTGGLYVRNNASAIVITATDAGNVTFSQNLTVSQNAFVSGNLTVSGTITTSKPPSSPAFTNIVASGMLVVTDGNNNAKNCYGIATAVHNGSGAFNLTFATAQPDTNYIVIATAQSGRSIVVDTPTKSTSGFTVRAHVSDNKEFWNVDIGFVVYK